MGRGRAGKLRLPKAERCILIRKLIQRRPKELNTNLRIATQVKLDFPAVFFILRRAIGQVKYMKVQPRCKKLFRNIQSPKKMPSFCKKLPSSHF